jgi:hypothetical protein
VIRSVQILLHNGMTRIVEISQPMRDPAPLYTRIDFYLHGDDLLRTDPFVLTVSCLRRECRCHLRLKRAPEAERRPAAWSASCNLLLSLSVRRYTRGHLKQWSAISADRSDQVSGKSSVDRFTGLACLSVQTVTALTGPTAGRRGRLI